jgi:hypothetical protein
VFCVCVLNFLGVFGNFRGFFLFFIFLFLNSLRPFKCLDGFLFFGGFFQILELF